MINGGAKFSDNSDSNNRLSTLHSSNGIQDEHQKVVSVKSTLGSKKSVIHRLIDVLVKKKLSSGQSKKQLTKPKEITAMRKGKKLVSDHPFKRRAYGLTR